MPLTSAVLKHGLVTALLPCALALHSLLRPVLQATFFFFPAQPALKMRPIACAVSLAATAVLTAEPFLNEPNTGLAGTNYTADTLPLLEDMRAVLVFEWAAHRFLVKQKYSLYRTAAGGEWSEFPVPPSFPHGSSVREADGHKSGYRNNLDIWKKVTLRPRHRRDVSKLNETLPYAPLPSIPLAGSVPPQPPACC